MPARLLPKLAQTCVQFSQWGSRARAPSLPFDGAGRLAGDVIHHAVHAAHCSQEDTNVLSSCTTAYADAVASNKYRPVTSETASQAGTLCGIRTIERVPCFAEASSSCSACRPSPLLTCVADFGRHILQKVGLEGVPVCCHAVTGCHRTQRNHMAMRSLVPLHPCNHEWQEGCNENRLPWFTLVG